MFKKSQPEDDPMGSNHVAVWTCYTVVFASCCLLFVLWVTHV